MKKISLCLIFACLAAMGFSQKLEISVGAGLSLSALMGPATVDVNGVKFDYTMNVKKLGLNVFGDLTYFLVNLDTIVDLGNTEVITTSTVLDVVDQLNKNSIDMAISLYGKLPISLGFGLNVFPLIGGGYNFNATFQDKGTSSATAQTVVNYLFLGVGFGGDFSLTQNIYLRPLVLFNWIPGFNGEYYKDILDYIPGPKTVMANGYLLKAGLNIGFKL